MVRTFRWDRLVAPPGSWADGAIGRRGEQQNRMTERSNQRDDADNAFLRLQNPSSVQTKIMSETEWANLARDANTARLKALRLEKAVTDRLTAASAPRKI